MSTTKSKLDTELVRELAEILRDADLGELEIEHEGLRVRVSKPAAPVVQTVAHMPAPAQPALQGNALPAATGTPPAGESAADNADAVKSPMVGTVYLSPEPGSKLFINEGDKVKKGDTLMLVEAMKTFNPVEAPRDGTVMKILVSDAQPIEYGEPLVIIS
jgi:acetyl-CoA carboxylase biotin carboxyl carrier protein